MLFQIEEVTAAVAMPLREVLSASCCEGIWYGAESSGGATTPRHDDLS